MSIHLETSRRNSIENSQDGELHWGNIQFLKKFARGRPQVKARTGPGCFFNCHGMTFASRRTKITRTEDIFKILNDDQWHEIDFDDISSGDIILYLDNSGDVNHSGTIVWKEPGLSVPWVCSKWGFAGEFIHQFGDVPEDYGPLHKFFRCKL